MRDEFGVPNIFGHTDADAAFGLAYAHAEDDFATIQQTLLTARGQAASVNGPAAATTDYLVALLGVHELVERRYEKDLTPQTRSLVEAYADGINAYAEDHPDEAIDGLGSVTGKDVVTGFTLTSPLFFGLDHQLRDLVDAKLDRRGTGGSNAFAVAPSRSTDGWTRLLANSHQPYEGPVAWYEARVHSEEGWDVEGALFPGAPFVLLGHNRNLGWTNTVNRPDLVDIYRLEIDPDDPDRYRLDGEWRRLKKGDVGIKVKLLGPISWTFHREVLRSLHGPVLRLPHGTFAIRYAGFDEIQQVEQYYRLNKAKTFEEFRDVMRMQAVAATNFIYADATGRIAYFYNARFPERLPGVDWQSILPGDRRDLIWRRYVSFDKVPQLIAPKSGFVFNSNNTPYFVSGSEDNLKREDFPAEWGVETWMTNRALRAYEQLSADEHISREDLLKYKFDLAYSPRSDVAAAVKEALARPAEEGSDLAEAQALLRRWDFRTDRANRSAALGVSLGMALTNHVWEGAELPDPATTLEAEAKRLRSEFGRIDVPLGEVQRLRRGEVDVPVDGGPDVLRAIDSEIADDGKRVATLGDSFVLLVEWDERGKVHSYSIQPFGSAVSHPESAHYADQAPLFAEMKFKEVWFDAADLKDHTTERYRPGQRGAKR